jgi:ribosome recycling factor
VIKPWDAGLIKEIEKGLVHSALEFNPVLESDILRINLPELTQETREKIVKKLRTMLEEGRIKLRTIRDEVKKEVERKAKTSEITEDDKYAFIEELNTLTRSFTEQIDGLGKQKEEDIMRI